MKTYFLGDLHLGAAGEDTHQNEAHVISFLEKISADAGHIYLLGDVLDYWYEYKHCVPKGYVRFFGELAKLSDSGIKITWIIGNHDIWIFDYLPQELGVEVCDGTIERIIDGKRFVMAHGDGLGPFIPGNFKFIRRLFRNRICQKLFSLLHPDFTIPFAHRWSQHSRESDVDQTDQPRSLYQSLKIYSEKYDSKGNKVDYFLYGHLHHYKRETLDRGAEIVVLDDWQHKGCYAEFDGKRLSIRNYFRNKA